MKRGHITGHKHERSGKGSNWWYQTRMVEKLDCLYSLEFSVLSLDRVVSL